MPATETGVWLEEIATPYYAFLAAGFEVDMASPKGGASPIDQGSLSGDFFTEASKKFLHDSVAMGKFNHQENLVRVNVLNYDAIYLVGGHGTCVDFVDNAKLTKLIENAYGLDKVVAADCHGPIGLAGAKKKDGTPLVQGLAVTGFTDSEEEAVGQTAIVPFLIESKFKELGAKFERSDDWNSHVAVDGNLVTGQNPQSSEALAAKVVELIKAKTAAKDEV